MDTWVYLIKDNLTGFHKIGKSLNPHQRLKDLKRQPTKMPIEFDLHIVEAWRCESPIETQLHRIYQDQRVRGEWFNLSIGNLLNLEELMCEFTRLTIASSQIDEDWAESNEVEHWLEEDINERMDDAYEAFSGLTDGQEYFDELHQQEQEEEWAEDEREYQRIRAEEARQKELERIAEEDEEEHSLFDQDGYWKEGGVYYGIYSR